MKKSLYTLVVILAIAALIGGYFAYRQWGGDAKSPLAAPAQNTPKAGAKASERQISQTVSSAVATNKVTITSCKQRPDPAEFPLGSKAYFVNNDTATRTISFNPTHVYAIAPRGTAEVTFDFWKVQGIRRYSCDGKVGGTIVLR